MTEEEHIDAIRKALPERGFASSRHVDAVEEALKQYPNSTRLWYLRGDLIQLNDDASDRRTLVDVRRSYERALEIDPDCEEAHEELGRFFEVVEGDAERARHHLRSAAGLRRGRASGASPAAA